MKEFVSRTRYFRVISTGMLILLYVTPAFGGTNCVNRLIGVENKYIIPDSSFTASSYYAPDNFVPSKARLNGENGWSPSTENTPGDYIQIDLGLPYVICAVATQGRSTGNDWVTEYEISISMDNTNWTPYQENGRTKTFVGNTNYHSIKKNTLSKPLARYIKFIPIRFNVWKTMRIGIYGYLEGCENLPLGMESGVIQDGSITASSAQNQAKNARLHYTSGSSWCASTSDSTPYLQIDLGIPYLICAVSTQGNSMADQWVKTYQITTSTDGTIWTTYQENNTDRTFYGNYDRKTVVRCILYQSIATRYLRIVPKTNQSTPCLRTEVYGYPIHSTCSSHSVGIPSSVLVPDHRFTATSYYTNDYLPYQGRLGALSAWASLDNEADQYLQVDLGDVFYICAVATQGTGYSNNDWVTKYKVLYSTDNNQWITYSDSSGHEKEFSGNSDKTTVVTNSMANPFRAKFLRFLPTTFNTHKVARIEFKGLPTGCVSSLGVENSQIPDPQMTSSSSSDNSHTASRGRLYGDSSWCSLTTSNTEYIQIDFRQIKTVTGIATQGENNNSKWVTSYKVSYSFDNRYWDEYREGQLTKVFNSNSNNNDVIVNWLRRPIAARYIRIYPQTSRDSHCLRLDLYGCPVFVVPNVTLDTGDLILPSTKGISRTLNCSVLGEPIPEIQWFNDGTKINGATQPTLQVHFVSAENMVSKYNCTRQGLEKRAVVCNTLYTCRATYPNYVPGGGMDEIARKVTVNLNVPNPPTVTTNPNKRSLQVNWVEASRSDDVGVITWYTIEFNNESSIVNYLVKYPGSSFFLTNLKPYTNYTVRMNAISSVGTGLWSLWKRVTTSLAVPEGIPSITRMTALTSQTIELQMKYSQLDLLHGPMAGFRIFYTPEGGAQQWIDVDTVSMTTLKNLRKYTNYSISVAVRNTLYVGPPSNAKRLSTLEDVPEVGPQTTRATKINDTTFLVTWQPLTRHQSNGLVTKYEIIWSFLVGRRSKKSIQDIFTATTQGTQYMMYNLKLCAKYTVSVRGYTSKGQGPKSTFGFFTLYIEPGKPRNVRVGSQTETSVQLKWEKPQEIIFAVEEYTIKVESSKEYLPQYNFSKTYTQNGEQTDLVIKNLRSGTSFEFWVLARTRCGQSEKNLSVWATTKENIPPNQKLPLAAITGSITAVLIILAVILVVVIFLKRRRPSTHSRKESTMYLDKIEDTENVDEGNEIQGNENEISVEQVASNSPSDDIYDEALDTPDKPIPVGQFPQYVRSMKVTEYARLKQEYKKIPNGHSYPRNVAKKAVNKKKNRYGNVVPYDNSRVVIGRTGEDEDSDYVNASYIRGYDGTPKVYIASQGPVVESFPDFWQMIWEQNTGVIVMLTNLVELGKTKCHKYWPENKETYRDITVNNHKTEMFPDYIIRTLLLSQTTSDETRHVLHFQFTVWPDKGVPHYATSVLGLRRTVRAKSKAQNSGPIVVHCSAGVGRTGCYIMVDAMLDRAKSLRNVDIKNYLSKMREDRISMVQTDEQYIFIHTAILEALTCGNTEIEAFNLKMAIMNKLTKINQKKNAPGYAVEFERLKFVTADYAKDECDVGRMNENASKNRSPDVIAMNHSRVKLMCEQENGPDYINASFVDAYRERNAFIMTQAPLPNTIEDFWIMVANYEIRTIVMLNTLQEDAAQYPQYWPLEGVENYGAVTVELQDTQDIGASRNIVARNLQVSYKMTTICVNHLQHLQWPDQSVPTDTQSVLNLLNEVQQSQRQAGDSPIVVQCSNGVGRSGTFCAIFSILERMKQEQIIDVFQVVKCIRLNRPGAVETEAQYFFCYQIIQKYLESFSDYANFSDC